MPNENKIHVRIENPSPGGQAETNLKRAQRYVRAGRAIFTGTLIIRFVNQAATQASRVVMARRQEESTTRRFTGRGYDQLSGNYFQHARNIPLLHPEKMLIAQNAESRAARRTSSGSTMRKQVHVAAGLVLTRTGAEIVGKASSAGQLQCPAKTLAATSSK